MAGSVSKQNKANFAPRSLPTWARWSNITGLKITAGQRTMSRLIGALTGQTFVFPVMLTGHVGWSQSRL